MDLSTPLVPLTPRQRALFWIAAAACAVTRLFAISKSLWDWDEALFCLGMRDYDVTKHHPHPPGFPVFIGMAKAVRLLAPSDFRALQTVTVIAALLAMPALFFFARELRLRFTTALIAAILFAFIPNVWFFGGTAFSDVPSIVLVLFAAALLLRGIRDRNAYWLGTLLLALAIGIRPQNLLVGLVPGILATRKRKPGEIAVALLIGVVVCTTAFGSAIAATGSFEQFMTTVRAHGEYISRIDSFRNPDRPPLWRLFDRFFVKQYQSPPLSVITSVFVLISIIGAIRHRDRRMLLNVATFGPFAIFAWLMLDRFSVSRFSIGYIPMFAVFAADGIARITTRRRWHEPAVGLGLAAAFGIWAFPALTEVRTQLSPPVRAIGVVQRRFDPKRQQLYVAYSMVPFVEYLAPQLSFIRVIDERALPLSPAQDAWLLAELDRTEPSGFTVIRERGRLWNIARRHYFEITLRPLRQQPLFGPGWYSPERNGMDEWRWMARRSVTILPAAHGRTKLRVNMSYPRETLPQHPLVTVTLNGKVLGSFHADAPNETHDFDVAPLPRANVLELAIDRTTPDLDAARDLGMQVRFLAWGAD